MRPPSLKTRDGTPPELVRQARDAIERGRTVTNLPTTSCVALVLLYLVLWVGGCLAVGFLLNSVPGMPRPLLVLLMLATMVALPVLLVAVLPAMRTPRNLSGRPVAGRGRVSTDLWSAVVAEVDAGTRPEDGLPAIHRALIAVANAEDKVNRLVSRSKYDLDQSRADVARVELVQRIAEARALIGLPELPAASPPYLQNRWAEGASVPEPPPENADDLR